MNDICQNGDCPKLANLTARVASVGDRKFCRACFENLQALMGDNCRQLPAETFIAEWRTRSLARVWEQGS